MHALAGTIGHQLIIDDEARQAAKTASRNRAFSKAIDAAVGATSTPSTATSPADDDGLFPADPELLRSLEDEAAARTVTGGISTAVSPAPHDAEAHRERERLEAAKHLEFIRLVRDWADGADVAAVPAAKVRKVLDDLRHEARRADESAGTYYRGAQDAFELAVAYLEGALYGLSAGR